VFVASNFVGERGDIAIIDDIEIFYRNNGTDCGSTQQQHSQPVASSNIDDNLRSSVDDDDNRLQSTAPSGAASAAAAASTLFVDEAVSTGNNDVSTGDVNSLDDCLRIKCTFEQGQLTIIGIKYDATRF
jgi:hypothetical protein